MQSNLVINKSNEQNYNILVIGEPGSAIITNEVSEDIQIQYCRKMLEAIEIVTANSFDLIAVVFGDFISNLKFALRTIRRIRPESKIILLTQIYEEPQAAKFIKRAADNEKVADDYAICPVSFTPARNNQAPQTAAGDNEIITQQKQKIEILEKLVMEDELTGLKNRRYVREFLRQILQRAQKESLHVTLLSFDIDNFKKYNDLYGHPVGDSILKQVAVLMQKCCRKQDVVGRIGGDEFAVVFWNLAKDKIVDFESSLQERRKALSEHPSEVINICDRFRAELNKTDLPALGVDGKGTLTISGGLARFPSEGATPHELFLQADNALMNAKKSGKNRVYLVGSEKKQQPPAEEATP